MQRERRRASVAAATAIAIVLSVGLAAWPVDTAGLDSVSREYVIKAEEAALRGQTDLFWENYNAALDRLGRVTQLAGLEQVYLAGLTDYEEAVEAHANFLKRWNDQAVLDPTLLDTVLQRVASLLLLAEPREVSAVVSGVVLKTVDRLLDDPISAAIVGPEIRRKTLRVCGQTSYSIGEYTRAARCFEEAAQLQGTEADTGQADEMDFLLHIARRRGKATKRADSKSKYERLLAGDPGERYRHAILRDIASGDWPETEVKWARGQLEGVYPDSPETLLLHSGQ